MDAPTILGAKEFENNPHFETIIKMRRWDEAAKVEAMKLPKLDYFINICEQYLIHQPKKRDNEIFF
jgi:predicted HD phosphohydrolase